MSETITFTCPLPPIALRRNRETRSNGYRAALIREYQEQVWCAFHARHVVPNDYGHDVSYCNTSQLRFKGGRGYPWERAKVTLTWRHHRAGPDEDNALASCKWLLDVLKATGPRPLGIVVDDSAAHMTVSLTTEKVRRKEDEGVIVTVERAHA